MKRKKNNRGYNQEITNRMTLMILKKIIILNQQLKLELTIKITFKLQEDLQIDCLMNNHKRQLEDKSSIY